MHINRNSPSLLLCVSFHGMKCFLLKALRFGAIHKTYWAVRFGIIIVSWGLEKAGEEFI